MAFKQQLLRALLRSQTKSPIVWITGELLLRQGKGCRVCFVYINSSDKLSPWWYWLDVLARHSNVCKWILYKTAYLTVNASRCCRVRWCQKLEKRNVFWGVCKKASYFTPFNGGSFILLQVNWCSREFSLHSVKGNHINLTLVHLEEETLPFSFSPPVSPLVRQANGLVGGEIWLPRCLLLLLATLSKLWQTLSTPGRSEELRELDTISLLVLALWALESEKQRLAILPVLEKLSDPTWFSFCHCKAAPLWPWTHAGETDNGFKRGKRETVLWIIGWIQCD